MSNNRQENWDKTFLKMAKDLSEMSHCVSRQVGALIVKDGRILSSGINGTPQGEINCDDIFTSDFDPIDHRQWSDDHEIHGEQNSLLFAARYGISVDGATMYCTLQPCNQCIKNIMQSGIKRIVFSQYYDRVENTTEIVKRLNNLGIEYKFLQL